MRFSCKRLSNLKLGQLDCLIRLRVCANKHFIENYQFVTDGSLHGRFKPKLSKLIESKSPRIVST